MLQLTSFRFSAVLVRPHVCLYFPYFLPIHAVLLGDCQILLKIQTNRCQAYQSSILTGFVDKPTSE